MADPVSPLPSPPEFQPPAQVLVVQPWKQRYWLHLLLLFGTIFTTLVVGARLNYNFLHNLPPFYQGEDGLSFFPLIWALQSSHLLLGVPFSLTLLGILLAHEMGHYLYCRSYAVAATLPFFIPFPTLIGTLGAFIRIRSPIRSRGALFDIGIAGPIAGFIVACFAVWFSLGLAKATAVPAEQAIEIQYPLIFQMFQHLRVVSGGHRAMADLRYLSPHPVTIAAWVGMFATALNLLPGGQLDGGHIVFSLAPAAHKVISRLTILALLPLAYYFWAGWALWAVLLAISGMRHPVVPRWPEMNGRRRGLAVFGLIMLVLTFQPAPFARSAIPDVVQTIRGMRNEGR